MQLQGHVKNGVVVPDGDFSLPEDSLVWLIPCSEPHDHMASAHHAELLAETRRIAALPLEVDQTGLAHFERVTARARTQDDCTRWRNRSRSPTSLRTWSKTAS